MNEGKREKRIVECCGQQSSHKRDSHPRVRHAHINAERRKRGNGLGVVVVG